MMGTLKINHFAVWVGVVLLSLLGFIWYGPLFGHAWMGYVGLDQAAMEAKPPGASTWISNTIATIIPLYTLAWIFIRLRVENAFQGAMVGLLMGFSFVFLSDMTGNMFAQHPYGLSWITGGYSMTALAVAGMILGGWRKYAG
ncbi:MAG: DUF1761 domain-containing protein [Saprospiraceae bacterium]|nr:DUF1761 domain-containing protein [Saprospiraceae bacterium]